MINLKSIVPNLQVPACNKENHDHEKLNMICLDNNCPDYLTLLCVYCQDMHKHRVYTLKSFVSQIIQVISQPNPNPSSNSNQIIEQFDATLKSINQLIGLCNQLSDSIIAAKTKFKEQPSNTTQIAQLLDDISNQDASTISEKMKKILDFLEFRLQDQIIINLKQNNQGIQQDVSDQLKQIQQKIQSAQNIIQDALKINVLNSRNQQNSNQQEQQQQQQLQKLNDLEQANVRKIQQQKYQYQEEVKQQPILQNQQVQLQQVHQQQNVVLQPQQQQQQVIPQIQQKNQPYQFVWNNDCEKKMKEDLKSFKPDKYPKECEKSYKKWKQLYSTLMQKTGGKQGFCGKMTRGHYNPWYDSWWTDLLWNHTCGKSDGCLSYFYCCKECWDKGGEKY